MFLFLQPTNDIHKERLAVVSPGISVFCSLAEQWICAYFICDSFMYCIKNIVLAFRLWEFSLISYCSCFYCWQVKKSTMITDTPNIKNHTEKSTGDAKNNISKPPASPMDTWSVCILYGRRGMGVCMDTRAEEWKPLLQRFREWKPLLRRFRVVRIKVAWCCKKQLTESKKMFFCPARHMCLILL